MGTPYYMAPEQARGDSALDQRVDLWAIGVIFYEALTGRRPFVATNYNALLVRILTAQPKQVERLQPGIHPEVSRLVHKALAKAREDRFQTARELRRALSEVEEICLAEDPLAPTRVMLRKPSATDAPFSTAEPIRVPWNDQIEDPDTFIDDESTQGADREPPDRTTVKVAPTEGPRQPAERADLGKLPSLATRRGALR